jgi:DDE superfamily endonuclease
VAVFDVQFGCEHAGTAGLIAVFIRRARQPWVGEAEHEGATAAFDDIRVPSDIRVVGTRSGDVQDHPGAPPPFEVAGPVTPLLVTVLADFVPTADDLDPGWYYIVDGTLLPCWTWRAHPELKSGKHRASGLKVILACTLNGHFMWVSDPVNGSRHDMHCLRESGLLEETDPSFFSGDTGFIGAGMITPIRKPRTRDLLDWGREFNSQIAKFRWIIEQVIANFKTWRIMHTDYRRPLQTFAETISAVVAYTSTHSLE